VAASCFETPASGGLLSMRPGEVGICSTGGIGLKARISAVPAAPHSP